MDFVESVRQWIRDPKIFPLHVDLIKHEIGVSQRRSFFLKAKKLEQKKDFFTRDDSVKATVDEPMQIDNNGASVCRRKLLHFV